MKVSNLAKVVAVLGLLTCMQLSWAGPGLSNPEGSSNPMAITGPDNHQVNATAGLEQTPPDNG